MALSAESGSPASPAGVCHVRWMSDGGAIDEIGSGILIDRYWVLTAAHVVKPDDQESVLEVCVLGTPTAVYGVDDVVLADTGDVLNDMAALRLDRAAQDSDVLPLLTDTAWYLSRWQLDLKRVTCWGWLDEAESPKTTLLRLIQTLDSAEAATGEAEALQLEGGVPSGFSGGPAVIARRDDALHACLGMAIGGGLGPRSAASSCLLGMGRILPWLRQHDIPHRTLSAKDRDVFTAVDWKPQAGEIQLGADADFPGLITWNTALTELLGRETELEALRTWANQAGVEKPLVCRVVHGEGGVGKTRLAAELADELSRDGWQVVMGRLKKATRAIGSARQGSSDRWLIVLDYPEYEDQAALTAELMDWYELDRPIAVLLLSRHGEGYWDRILGSCLNPTQWQLDFYPLPPLTPDASYRLLVEALHVFGIGPERVDQTMYEAWLTETQERIFLCHPLLILGQALCLAADPALSFRDLGHQQVIQALVAREYGRLLGAEKAYQRLSEHEEELTLRLQWLAILTGPLSLSTLLALSENEACVDLGLPERRRLAAVLDGRGLDVLRDTQTEPVLEPLAPDVVAAGFAWHVWGQPGSLIPRHGAAWLAAVLTPDSVVDVLERIGQRRHDVDRWLKLPTGPMTQVLIDVLMSDLDLCRAASRYYLRDTALMPDVGVAVFDRLVEEEREQQSKQQATPEDRDKLAGLLNSLSVQLAKAGDRSGGLETIQESVAIRRSLAKSNFAAFGPELAGSLNNLSLRLGETGDRAGGLEAIQEASGINRDLAETNFAAYGPYLAMSLNNLSVDLAKTGNRAGGLEAVKEAVAIRRSLAETNFAGYGPDLAMSLNNLSVHMAETGDWAGGLEASQEANGVYRDLAETNFAAYGPYLAMSLNNLSIGLAENGDRAGGLEAIQEASGIYRDLAETNFAVYGPDLAMSLNNLSNRLSETGDLAEGLEAIQEASGIYRDLAKTNFAAYGPDLAMSLNNLSVQLGRKGDRAGGLEAIQEASGIYRDLAKTNFAAYGPDLAMSLNNLSIRLAETGDWAVGLEAIQEAVAIRRSLAETNFAAYGQDLAQSLNVLSDRLRDQEQFDEAIAANTEAARTLQSLHESGALTIQGAEFLSLVLRELVEQHDALGDSANAQAFQLQLVDHLAALVQHDPERYSQAYTNAKQVLERLELGS